MLVILLEFSCLSSQPEIINVINTSLSITPTVSFLLVVVRTNYIVEAGSTLKACAFDVRVVLIAGYGTSVRLGA